MGAVSLTGEHRWSCTRCPVTTVTHDAALPMHICAGLGGLSSPLTPDGVRCKVQAIEREDYVGGDLAQTDENGRAVMAIRTTRDDGEDLVVLAPCATAGMEARY